MPSTRRGPSKPKRGGFFFENRFTTDEQAGKTIHLYFLAAGWLAKAVGIPIALHIFRVVFGFLALLALFRFISRVVDDEVARKVAFVASAFCAGVGFLFWRNYGFEGPIDVWQPEAFVFPMLMQSGLFCAALCLMLVVWNCILDARASWKSVLPGTLALLVLTNIHTYDTLLVAVVGVGFLAGMIGSRLFSWQWLGRVGIIAAGALPAVAWFVYVRGIDPVFAARADTVTISAPIWSVVAGVFPALILAGFGLAKGGDKKAVFGAAGLIALIAVLQQSMDYRMSSIWASIPLWTGLAVAAVALCWAYKPRSPGYGLLFAWVLLGLVAIYYPGLFQRKLAMALALPIGVSAAVGVCSIAALRQRRTAVLAGATAILLGGTNVLWLVRETSMAVNNISNTTMQQVYWPAEVSEFLDFFRANAQPGDAVIAMPGVAVPDDFENPRSYMVAIPDLNPVLSGWGGVTTFIGHWSETPDYLARRQRVMQDVFSNSATQSTVYDVMHDARANYIVAPTSEIASQAGVPPRDFFTGLGEVVYEGDNFVLVRYLASP